MLPGGLLSLYLYKHLDDKLFGLILPEDLGNSSALWVVFLFAAYLLRHIVFLVASYLDATYDWIRPGLWPDKEDNAYNQTDELKKQMLGKEKSNTMNTFQWAKAILRLCHSEGLVEVARLEADSKFFRTLFIAKLGFNTPPLAAFK